MERGIADDASIVAKAQLEVARARLEAAVSELQSKTISVYNDVEKTVENLAIEIITSMDFLEAAYAAHLEAKEYRVGATMAREQDNINWEKELKEAEKVLERLN
ncbi:hypothetical protein CQW23_20113 [Capsicum baccatum]|uniref:Uncharacterized protein n=1 Tax=Capsicum baccatum TaxID=33114 RepID=A0A2G2W7T4_CAPBA|nr:hypothetical protein CQW23_20113 [Capsicum baccatum]